ncbi:inverse autotransporter beta-barrel domain-containing protein [Verrucomicrobium sp. BvORR106]|uniref:inverse autotransporter beta domain-containing protein n=1 Tax=Verrucomicrobium sp. BvORR106 TaxID=1403819 RepID=UPI00056F3E1A|nr:inverse autotransporter beta-barrel domain-containing protein [Verrucomicrobium sp. BvORR106]
MTPSQLHPDHLPTPRFLSAALRRLALITAPLAVATATSLQAGPLEKNPVKNPSLDPVQQEAPPLYLGTITGGVKTSDAYTEGNFSIVAPVYSTLGADTTLSGDVLYLEPYTSWGEGGEVAASLGLGWRHLFGSQPVSALTRKDTPQAGFLDEGFFVGANLFIDMLDTEANNQFWQLGVGVEFGTRYLEVRGNYYIPLSDKQLAEQTRTREVLRNSSSRDATSITGVDDPYATGHSVLQDVSYRTLRTTTTTTTTIERLFSRYEEGMEGWDAEVALLVPGLDNYFDLRLIGGYYSFDNQPFGPQTGGTGNVEGWKAGVEVRPVPAVILTGTWYEDARLTGSDWTAGVQLQLPFEAGDLGDGKGFWGRIGDAFKPRRRHLAERLAEPVRRQNAAIKVANTVDVDTKASTSVKKVTKVVSQGPGKVVLADDIVFVNNGEAVGNGIQEGSSSQEGADGTAEKPFNNISDGATLAGDKSSSTSSLWSVYTQGGTGASYSDQVYVGVGSTRFISSFTPIQGLAGKQFGGDTARPIMEGGINAANVNTLVVTGYEIRDGYDLGDGYHTGVNTEGVQNVTITDNVFADISTWGVSVMTFQEFNNVVIQDNRFTASGGGLSLVAYEGQTDALLLNNQVDLDDSEATGFQIRANHEAFTNASTLLNVEIAGNTFEGTMYDGISITAYNLGTLNAEVKGNTLSGTFETGIHVEAFNSESEGLTSINADIIGNTFSGTFGQGEQEHYSNALHLNALYNSRIDADIAGNLFSGNSYSGIGMAAAAGASIYANVTDNTFSGDFTESVIHVTSYDEDALIDTNITGNTLLGNVTDYDFLWLLAYSTSNIRATVASNTIGAEASLGDGFAYLYAQDSGNITVEGFDNNALLGTADYYLWLDNSGTGSVQVDGTLSAPFSNAAPALNTSDINVFGTASGKIFFNGAEFDFANP